MKKYIVGGYVRDKILGIESNDIDYVVTGQTVESMLKKGYIQVGKSFPVFIHNETKHEYALARSERKTDKGYKGFSFDIENISLLEDLSRRDLTINSIAINENGLYIDPFEGVCDIKNKILKHTSDKFIEDPLRVLRLARFKTKFHDFSINKSTILLAISLKNKLKYLSNDRVFKELKKVLLIKKPSLYFITLNKLSALEVVYNELFTLKNIKYNVQISQFDYKMKLLDIVATKTSSNITKFAVLYYSFNLSKCSNFYLKFKKMELPNSYSNFCIKIYLYSRFIININNYDDKTIVENLTNRSFFSDILELKEALIIYNTMEFLDNNLNRNESFNDKIIKKNQILIDMFKVLQNKIVFPKYILAGSVNDLKEYQLSARIKMIENLKSPFNNIVKSY